MSASINLIIYCKPKSFQIFRFLGRTESRKLLHSSLPLKIRAKKVTPTSLAVRLDILFNLSSSFVCSFVCFIRVFIDSQVSN